MLVVGRENIIDMDEPENLSGGRHLDLLGHFLAKNEDGTPIIRFRGEHGEISGDTFQSRLPNISFGDFDSAREYSLSPNNNSDVVHTSRIHAGYVISQFPVIETDDPFIDLSRLIDLFGFEETKKFALRSTEYIEETNAWEEICAEFEDDGDNEDWLNQEAEISSVSDFIERHPERMGELCLLAHVAFDDAEISRMTIEAGFDSIIHGPFGIVDEGYEHKIFDARQFVAAENEPSFFSIENIELLIEARLKKFLLEGIRNRQFPIVPQIEYITKSDYYRDTLSITKPLVEELGSIMNWKDAEFRSLEKNVVNNISEWIRVTNFKKIAYLTAKAVDNNYSTSRESSAMEM